MAKRPARWSIPVAVSVVAGIALLGCGALAEPLCVDGRPAKRSVDVTYAQLPPRHGYVRDHRVPLGLGGADTADNVQYQPRDEARLKDRLEWYAIESYCAGTMDLTHARTLFIDWRASYKQVFGVAP